MQRQLRFVIVTVYLLIPSVKLLAKKTSCHKMANSENSNETTDQLFAGKQLVCRKKLFLNLVMSLPEWDCNLFHGVWKEKEVAVRRIQKTQCLNQWEKMVVRHENGSLNHENVLKILGFDEDTDFR